MHHHRRHNAGIMGGLPLRVISDDELLSLGIYLLGIGEKLKQCGEIIELGIGLLTADVKSLWYHDRMRFRL